MQKTIKVRKSEIVFTIIVMFLAGFMAGTQFGSRSQEQLRQPELGVEVVVSMALPAVDSEGNGVVGILYTTVKPGTGKILVDTSRVLNYIDTQLSARTAATAASNYAKVNLSSVDIVYTIRVNASIIEGPSAGASMALSVLLALENKTSDNIAITGTINPDWSIGKVGSILEKGLAAKENGTKIFLVPQGQSTAEKTTRNTTCSRFGQMDVCKVNYDAETIDISSYLGMEVHEVKDLHEAYQYFNRTS